MHKKMTSRHEDNLFVYLLSAEIDPSLLLHLAVSGLIIAQNSCTVYLNDLLFQRVLSPFAKRLGATLPEQELKRGTAQLLKFCRSDPSDFLLSTSERLAGINSILAPHLTPETASQVDEDLKTEAPHFSKFFQAVTTRLKKEIPPVSPKAFVCGMKKDFTITEYAKHKEAWCEHIPFFFQTYNQIINKNCLPNSTSLGAHGSRCPSHRRTKTIPARARDHILRGEPAGRRVQQRVGGGKGR